MSEHKDGADGSGEPVVGDLDQIVREKLPGILAALRESDVAEIEIETSGASLRLHRNLQPAEDLAQGALDAAAEMMASSPQTVAVMSQLVGTFYRAEKPGMAPLVAEGSRVDENTVVGIIEALQVLTEIEAGVSGTVTKVMATDGEPVQYGQTLLEVVVDG